MSLPSKDTDPAVTRRSPEMVLSVVVLPAPLAPDEGDDLAVVDVQGDAVEGSDLAVVDLQVVDLKKHRTPPRGRP